MKTKHDLQFEVADWPFGDFQRFRVGTCEGLWRSTNDSYDILAITNNEMGNGHFTDVLEWFNFSCKRDKRVLRILEVWNKDLKNHLLKKGFKDIGNENIEKSFIST